MSLISVTQAPNLALQLSQEYSLIQQLPFTYAVLFVYIAITVILVILCIGYLCLTRIRRLWWCCCCRWCVARFIDPGLIYYTPQQVNKCNARIQGPRRFDWEHNQAVLCPSTVFGATFEGLEPIQYRIL